MCELLGMNFNRPVRLKLSFRGFRHRGENNSHGWGVARFLGRGCQVFKEPASLHPDYDSQLAEFLSGYDDFASHTFIAHVRRKSAGEIKYEDTHPFVRTFRRREVALAHNGTIDLDDSGLRFHPAGGTDSEALFCQLLTRLSQSDIPWNDYGRIEPLLREFNQSGTMNLLFSDGKRLYAYCDQNGHNGGLCVARRVAPFGAVRLKDEDLTADLAEEKHPEQRGVIVANRGLTDENWTPLTRGALSVFADGERVYGGG